MRHLSPSPVALLVIALGFHLVQCQVPADQQVIFDQHNAYRVKHGAPPLVWDSSLAAAAQGYANTCPSGHDPNNNYRGWGENLWAGVGYSVAQAHERVTVDYYNEIATYNFGNPGASTGVTGHFTQLVWVDTKRVGCATNSNCGSALGLQARTNSRVIISVCKYSPPGNVKMVGGDAYSMFKTNVLPSRTGSNAADPKPPPYNSGNPDEDPFSITRRKRAPGDIPRRTPYAAPKPAPKPARKPTPKPARKPTPKPARKPTPKPARKPAPQPYPKPAPKPYPQPIPKPAPKPAPKPYSKPTPKPAPRPAPQPYPKPVPKPYPPPIPKPAPKPAPKPYPQPIPKPAPKPAPPPYPSSPSPTEVPLPTNMPAPCRPKSIQKKVKVCRKWKWTKKGWKCRKYRWSNLDAAVADIPTTELLYRIKESDSKHSGYLVKVKTNPDGSVGYSWGS